MSSAWWNKHKQINYIYITLFVRDSLQSLVCNPLSNTSSRIEDCPYLQTKIHSVRRINAQKKEQIKYL